MKNRSEVIKLGLLIESSKLQNQRGWVPTEAFADGYELGREGLLALLKSACDERPYMEVADFLMELED